MGLTTCEASRGVELPGSEADHSRPSSAEGKDGGNIHILLLLLHGLCLINLAQGQIYIYLYAHLIFAQLIKKFPAFYVCKSALRFRRGQHSDSIVRQATQLHIFTSNFCN
jgi:hypothetical protein